MAVLINFKICDNAKECDGIAVCPTGAFSWDEEKETIFIKEDLCINCGQCECCSVGAVKVTHSDEEYERVKKEIEEDPRVITDLFVDRYGAAPIQPEFLITEEEIDLLFLSKRPFLLEFFSEDSIRCLLKSIPVKELLQEFDKNAVFRKVKITTDKLLNKYNIKDLPALVFIKNGKVLDIIEGYYEEEIKTELLNKIKSSKISL